MLRLFCGWPLIACGFVLVVTLADPFAGSRFGIGVASRLSAQEVPAPSESSDDDSAKTGYLLDVPLPITSQSSDTLVATLKALGEKSSQAGRRQIVLLRFGQSDAPPALDGRGTEFESSLRLARAIGSPELRSLRVVAFVAGPVRGHAVLSVLACDQLVVTPAAELGDASIDESEFDETIGLLYESLAARRGVFPPPLVKAMLDPDQELSRVKRVDGTEVFVGKPQLETLREEGQVLQEEQVSSPGQTVLLSGNALRQSRLASHQVTSVREAADVLDVAQMVEPNAVQKVDVSAGVLVEITGIISSGRIRRLEANLAAPKNDQSGDAWLIALDSPGGSLSDSLRLASTLSVADEEGRIAAGWVENEALGDSVLIAAACRPLLVADDARLGGPGAQSLASEEVRQLREAIEQIAGAAGRPAALLEGLLDPQLDVFRYTDAKTGRVRYASEDRIARETEQRPDQEERWQKGARIDLSEGISGAEAVELGLADGLATSLEEVSRSIGLEATPRRLSDRPVIRAVEWLGNRPFLPLLLLMIGFMTFSMEISAPGLGIPGFISLICFMLFFWMSFLAGTAEWLEVMVFALGVICILIEIFVVPGVGVFGIGGLLLLIGGVVLTSQTFVIPSNPYQYARMSESLWTVIVACGSLVAGVLLLRFLLPNTKLFGHLHLATPDAAVVNQREQMVDFLHLVGQTGLAVTPLRPAGKARFGDEIYGVISEGSAISEGEAVRVLEVFGNRIVVQADEST